VSGQYFKIKAAIVSLYLALVVGTVLWVFLGMPNELVMDFKAELNSVPGDYGGRPVVVVANRGNSNWQNVRVIVDELCVYTAPGLSASDQLNLPLDAFVNIYTTPRDWNRPPFARLSHAEQLLSSACPLSQVSSIELRCDQGQLKSNVSSQ
jgi:hypothetical protein